MLFLILYYVVKLAVKNGVLAAWETIKTELPAAAPADRRAEENSLPANNKSDAKGDDKP